MAIVVALAALAVLWIFHPRRVRDVPPVSGMIRAGGRPLAGARIALAPGEARTADGCAAAPVHATTAANGVFRSDEHHTGWTVWLRDVAEGRHFGRWSACVESRDSAGGMAWRPLLVATSNVRERATVVCAADAPWRDDPSAGVAGRCQLYTEHGAIIR